MDDKLHGIKEDLKRVADEEGDVLCRAALRRIEALEAKLESVVNVARPFSQMVIRNGTQVVCDVTPTQVYRLYFALKET